MPEAIHYCDRCRKIIPPADINAKAAFVRDEVSYCATCVATLPADQQAALNSSRATQHESPRHARPSASRRPSTSSSGRRPEPVKGRRRRKTPPAAKKAAPAVVLAAGAGVGLVAGLVVVVVLLGGDGEPAKAPSTASPAPGAPMPPPAPVVRTPPSPAPAAPAGPAAAPSPAPEPAASAAPRRLAAAKELIDPGLNRYDEASSALAAVAREFAGTPQAVEAERLVTEIDAKHAEIAEEALKSATDYANDLARMSNFEGGKSALRSVQARYRGTKWYVTRGEAAVAEALSRLTRMQKEDEEKRNRPLRPEEIAAGGVEVINDFETEHDLKMFSSSKGSVSLSRQHVTHGVTSMRVDAGTYLCGWPIVNYRCDWSGYDSLRIDIYNDTGGPAKVLIRVWDEESATGGDQEYWNRHNSGKTLREGANVFTMDLHDLYRGESGRRNTITGRNVDLDKIKRFDLGFKGTQGAFYLDTMRLVKAAR